MAAPKQRQNMEEMQELAFSIWRHIPQGPERNARVVFSTLQELEKEGRIPKCPAYHTLQAWCRKRSWHQRVIPYDINLQAVARTLSLSRVEIDIEDMIKKIDMTAVACLDKIEQEVSKLELRTAEEVKELGGFAVWLLERKAHLRGRPRSEAEVEAQGTREIDETAIEALSKTVAKGTNGGSAKTQH